MKVSRIIVPSDSTFKVKMTQSFLSVHGKKSHFDLKIWVKIFSVSNSTFWVKMTYFFSRCSERKNWVILTQKFGSNFNSASVSIFFRSKWLIFLSVHDAKKLSNFDLKIWVKFLFCQWLIFLGQNDSFFLSVNESEKIESFWPKNLGQILVPPVIQFF